MSKKVGMGVQKTSKAGAKEAALTAQLEKANAENTALTAQLEKANAENTVLKEKCVKLAEKK